MKTYLSYLAIAISVVAFVVALVGNQPSTSVGTDLNTRFPHGINVTANGCYGVDGTCIIDKDGNVDGVITTTTINASGATIVEGFQTGGAATVLTDATGGAYVLTEAQLIASGTLEFAAGGLGQEVIALTMPATSTMTTLIPNAGDCRTWLYDASALATATTTTLTKGDGHHIIAYTNNDDLIDGAEFAQIQMCRRTDTDVNTIVSELIHAD